nr:hypothetical transcript [Hymenolepis microstoma]
MLTTEQLDAIKAATASCGLSRSRKSSIASKKTTYSLFNRGAQVRLADGSIQKVEGLRTADFLRAAKSIGTESNQQWLKLQLLWTANATRNSLFSCSSMVGLPVIHKAHLPFYGLPCLSLSVGDHYLVVVPVEIAKLIPSSAQLPLVDFKSFFHPLLFSAKWKDMFSDPPKYVSKRILSPVNHVMIMGMDTVDRQFHGRVSIS